MPNRQAASSFLIPKIASLHAHICHNIVYNGNRCMAWVSKLILVCSRQPAVILRMLSVSAAIAYLQLQTIRPVNQFARSLSVSGRNVEQTGPADNDLPPAVFPERRYRPGLGQEDFFISMPGCLDHRLSCDPGPSAVLLDSSAAVFVFWEGAAAVARIRAHTLAPRIASARHISTS